MRWPNEAEMLTLPFRQNHALPGPKSRVMKRYPVMDWCFLADQMPEPRLFVFLHSWRHLREVPHSHVGILSFHAIASGQERLIDNIGINGGDEYLDTTFSARRFDLFETRPDSKNTIFVNGVSIRASRHGADPPRDRKKLELVASSMPAGR